MRRLQLPPIAFAVGQLLSICAPLFFIIGLILVWWQVAYGGRNFWPTIVQASIYALSGGGIALGYLGWWMSLTFRGIASTPSSPWKISVSSGVILIEAKRTKVELLVSRPKSFAEVWDDNWDKLKGLEDKSLVIHLGLVLRIIVPGSSENFNEAILEIKKSRSVAFKAID